MNRQKVRRERSSVILRSQNVETILRGMPRGAKKSIQSGNAGSTLETAKMRLRLLSL
jgi:hypothetical protein